MFILKPSEYQLLQKALQVRRNTTEAGSKLSRLYVPSNKQQTSQYDDKNFIYDAEVSRASGHLKNKWQSQRNMSHKTESGFFRTKKDPLKTHGPKSGKRPRLGKRGDAFKTEAHPGGFESTI